jgi:bifunctional non-homologous end joining protein LigD
MAGACAPVTMTAVDPMMATLAPALPVGADWSYEVKWDGYRAMLLKDDQRVRLMSRNMKDLSRDYPQITEAASTVAREPFIIDGEIVALDERGKPTFQALQHRSVERTALVFYAFDLLQFDGINYQRKPLSERRRALHRLRFAPPILLSSPLPGSPKDIERLVRELGLEGVVAKRSESIYEPGRRSRAWIKVKFSQQQEFVIGGYKPAGRSFDSVLVGFYERKRLLYAGKVRAGFTPRTRQDVWERITAAPLSACPFDNLPNSVGKSHWGEGITAEDMPTLRWVKPELVVQVAFTEWTAGGNLRHAAFHGIREDKRPRAIGPDG